MNTGDALDESPQVNGGNNVATGGGIGSSSSSNLFFTKLKKFSGEITDDLNTWVREFERCCVIANKTDDLVKGQFLMFCIGGRAKAVLDDFEAERGESQTFTALMTKLRTIFDDTTSRESKMAMFEERRQKIGETEEEFMLSLLRLHKNANPDATPLILNAALKRKFLQGITPSLKRNLFIFCTNPYSETVSREELLAAARQARNLVGVHPEASSSLCPVAVSTDKTEEVLDSIKKLSLQIGSHFTQNNEISGSCNPVAAVAGDNRSFNSRNSRYRGYNRQFRGRGSQRTSSNSGANQNSSRAPGSNTITCYKCGGQNHFAKHCTSRTGRSLNE